MHELTELKSASVIVVQFLSDRMLDPHLYFRLRYTGLVDQAGTAGELRAAMAGLVEWILSGGLDATQRQMLDEALAAEGLPALDELA